MGDKKICGILPRCELIGENCYVSLGIGVNINISPMEGSTCLKDELGF